MKQNVLLDQWELGKTLGVGTFSEVVLGGSYTGTHRLTGREAALKLGRSPEGSRLLYHESEVLRQLASCPHVPKLYEFKGNAVSPYIAMEQVGCSLESLRRRQAFSSKSIAMVGMQLVAACRSLHSCGFVHRDVKPDNLAVSLQSKDQKIVLLDLGIASRYLFQGIHYQYGEDVGFKGSQVFCSKGVLQGIRPSRRDDLESVCYVLVYLARNGLPWDHINSSSAEVSMLHMRKKLETSTAELCQGLAPEYRQCIDYCRALHFEEKPDYDYLSDLLRRAAEREGFCGVWDYDWKSPKPKRPKHVKVCSSSNLRRLASTAAETRLEQLSTTCTPEDVRADNRDPEKRLPDPREEPDTPLVPNLLNIEAVRGKLKRLALV